MNSTHKSICHMTHIFTWCSIRRKKKQSLFDARLMILAFSKEKDKCPNQLDAISTPRQ